MHGLTWNVEFLPISECFEDRNEPIYFVLGGKNIPSGSSLNLCTNVRNYYSYHSGQILLYNTCTVVTLSLYRICIKTDNNSKDYYHIAFKWENTYIYGGFLCFQTFHREYLTLPSLKSQEKNEPPSSQGYQTSTLLDLQCSTKKSSMVSSDGIVNPRPSSIMENKICSFTSARQCPRRACLWT